MAASEQMPRDAVKTIIGDREADIFELFSRIPTDNVHLLIRSVHERNCRLDDPDCSVHLNTLMEQAVLRAEYSFEVLPGSGRKKRVACALLLTVRQRVVPLLVFIAYMLKKNLPVHR